MKKILLVLLCACALTACRHEDKRSYWDAEMEPQQVEIVRFDKALLSIRTDNAQNTKEDIQSLYDSEPEFMTFWVENIMGIPAEDTALLVQNLPLYLNDTIYGFKKTNELEQVIFADITDLQSSLDKAFTRIKHLYPNVFIPAIELFPSIFVTSLISLDAEHFIGVGADMYLGSDYPLYDQVVYDYQRQGMRKECIPVDVTLNYLNEVLPYPDKQNCLLEQMLWRGRVMYLTAQILDELPGYEVMGWTKEQWDWSIRYEANIWHKIMDQQALYKRDNLLISHYLNEAPFTTEIVSDETDQDSPGRLGIWIGWRIVESYMEHHPEVTLQELMAEPDAQKILKLSLYQP